MTPEAREQPVRAAELVGAISLATDLGTGQPLEHALRTAVLAVRLGELAGASPAELSDTYYVALLHASGCTSNSHEAAQIFGDDIGHRAAFFLIDPADPTQVLGFYREHLGVGRPAEVRESMLEAALADPTRTREAFAAMCEVAQRFATWLGLAPGVQQALEYVFARWDGKGLPREVGGEALPLPARLLHVARDISLFLSAGGPEAARTVIEERAGDAYEPRLVELALADFDEAVDELDETRLWQIALDREPFPQIALTGDRIDAGFEAIATLIGLKSPWLREHSVTRRRPGGGGCVARRSSRPTTSRSSVGRRSRTTSAGSAFPTRSGRSPGRSASASGSAFACTRTSPSARSPIRRRLPSSGAWPAPTTSASTARGTTATRRERACRRRRASSPRRIATRPCARRGPTGRRSSRRKLESSSNAR